VKLRRVLLSLIAPIAALVFAVAVSSVALVIVGKSPVEAFKAMFDYGTQANSLISTVNRAVPLFLAGLAVAIGFKMNLFNIGVDGQYRLAALIAAAVGAAVELPSPIHIGLIIVTAMAVGAFWAWIPGILKVKRGVSEVISTIMLNFVATGLSAYLLANYLAEASGPNDLIINTPEISDSGRIQPINNLYGLGGKEDLFGFVIIAAIVGVVFYLLVWRTRFGYDLRSSGLNPPAARVGGVDPGAMIVRTMIISGAIAGLVGMSDLLGFFHQYTLDFPIGYGFAGIAVALLGRNHPVGIALSALLFGFLDRSAQILDLKDVPKEVITIMTGVIILSVVVAYEVVSRLIEAQEVRAAAEKTKGMAAELEGAAA
jgi:simple sugar transport system permease protein